MNKYTLKWIACGLLALGLCVLAASSSLRADDKEDEKEKEAKKAMAAAQQDVIKLIEGKGSAEAVAKKHELGAIMKGTFKLRRAGGIGVGNKPGAITPDGIEAKIRDLDRKPAPDQADLAKEAAAIAKIGETAKVIAGISDYKVPAPMPEKDPKQWKKFNEEMKKNAQELIDAAKASDPTRVKMAARKLNANCNQCHSVFRDAEP